MTKTIILGGSYREASQTALVSGLSRNQWVWVHDARSARGLDGDHPVIDLGDACFDGKYAEARDILNFYRDVADLPRF